MPRSDRSSDPEDGSVTSEGSDNEETRDEQAVGPTPPAVPTNTRAPWSLNTTGQPTSPGGIRPTSPQSMVSPSRWEEALQMPPLVAPGKPNVRLTGPNARFRAVVLKVVRINRMRNLSDEEPGVDIRSDTNAALYGHIRAQCSIEVVDYGAVRYRSKKLSNHELEGFIAHETKTRPLWSKVRWINIGGVSWDVVKCLALRYNIHPLAIEDMLHNHQTYSSKADYYPSHLFIRILCHTLGDESHPPPLGPAHTTAPTAPTYSSRPEFTAPPDEDIKFQRDSSSGAEVVSEKHKRGATDPVTKDEKERKPVSGGLASLALGAAQPWVGKSVGGTSTDAELSWAESVNPDIVAMKGVPRGFFSRTYSQHMTSLFSSSTPSGNRQTTAQATVNELKKGDRLQVNLRNLFILLTRDGTLITVHQDPQTDFFDPILSRLQKRDTLLRNTSDASMLLQNVLDLIVDNAVLVIEKYQQQLLGFERDILIRPKMSTVRSLHIASGDFTMHKRTLGPIKTLIYGLRRYDLDRCIATANTMAPGFDEKKVEGFLSHKAKVYMADVMDHMDYILASLDMFGTMTENLIAYTFNTVSYDMNTTVEVLTIMTVIFFPLSFLTGYFGMNFQTMPSVQTHSEVFFWELTGPIMFGVIILALSSYFVRIWHYFKKRRLQQRIRDMMS